MRTLLALLLLVCALTGHTQRSAADIERDRTSKPAAVLALFGVQRGWHVMDMFAGDGYYSEILSEAVGPGGKVYLHNNQAYRPADGRLAARLQAHRLPNVEVYIREVQDINLRSASLDMVMLVKAYHDAYFQQNGWSVTAAPLLKTIHRVLKPGGVLGIVDHHAPAGSGSAAAQRLHRIDVAFAKQDITRHGFALADATDVLENPLDDLHIPVFDPSVRGRTSRFVLKFVKPE